MQDLFGDGPNATNSMRNGNRAMQFTFFARDGGDTAGAEAALLELLTGKKLGAGVANTIPVRSKIRLHHRNNRQSGAAWPT